MVILLLHTSEPQAAFHAGRCCPHLVANAAAPAATAAAADCAAAAAAAATAAGAAVI